MGNRSSISSSEQDSLATPSGDVPSGLAALPWAAILALFLAVVIDRGVFGLPSVWQRLEVPWSAFNLLEIGLVRDRLELLAIGRGDETGGGRRDAGTPLVFLVGSSRLERGFVRESLPGLDVPPERLVKLAHPHLFPFEMRAAADLIATYEPEVVVLALAELETHAQIELRAESSFGSAAAVAQLVGTAGPAFAFDHRTALLRIILAQLLDTYHYRNVLDRVATGRWRRFESGTRLKRKGLRDEPLPTLAGQQSVIPEDELAAIVAQFDARFPGRGSMVERKQFGIVRSIATGHHAQINLGFVRRTIEILTQAGARVILIEPPIYPGARVLYDQTTRTEFLRFARQMARDERVRFVGLENGPGYESSDFGDLTHLERRGALVFTRVVVEAISRELAGASSRAQGPAVPTRRGE